MQMIQLRQLEANPYRHIERYVINEEKIAALQQSYQNSGFWDGSLQARPHPTKADRYQLAFGHHRLEAAKRQKIDAVGVVVSPRSNADMLRMMADENREFKHDALVAVETIAAVVEAYQKGEVELEAVSEDTNKAYVYALPGGRAYSLATVARFLGWVKADGQATAACHRAFDAYRERASTEEALLTLAPEERSEVAVATVVKAAQAARVQAEKVGLRPAKVREAERYAAQTAAREIKESSGSKARHLAVQIGKEAVASVTGPKAKNVPPVEGYILALVKHCKTAEPYGEILTSCRDLKVFVRDLNPALMKRLAKALRHMQGRSAVRVNRLVQALESGNPQTLVAWLNEQHRAPTTEESKLNV